MTIIGGRIWEDGFVEGYAVVEDGILTDLVRGKCPNDVDHRGTLFPGMVDWHTHIGDAGLVLDRKYSLEELVAPPDGLKHRYLASVGDEKLTADMADYSKKLKRSGISKIVDFREGGKKGCELLRKACPDAVILGRPVSKEFDTNEIDDILSIADGIGIPSISDMNMDYISKISDRVHKKGKMLALHASERIREDIDFIISLEPDFLVHMCQSSDGDLRKCSDAGIPIVACPRSNEYFSIRTPFDRMVKANVEILLGTDNAMLSTPRAFGEIETARKIIESQGMDGELAYRFAFSNEGKSLNVRHLIECQIGNRADMTLVSDNSMLVRYF